MKESRQHGPDPPGDVFDLCALLVEEQDPFDFRITAEDLQMLWELTNE
jgi:hypothetical protein